MMPFVPISGAEHILGANVHEPPKETTAQAYVKGWRACYRGEDGRYTNPYSLGFETKHRYAWTHGFLDAMEAEDGEDPDPESAGYS